MSLAALHHPAKARVKLSRGRFRRPCAETVFILTGFVEAGFARHAETGYTCREADLMRLVQAGFRKNESSSTCV